MKRNLILMLACLAATGLIAAGCGDDDDDGGDGGGDALTKEEYLAQGNANCEEGDAALQDDPNGRSQPGTPEFDAFIVDTFVPNIQGQIDFLRDGIPEEDADQVNGILDDAQAELDEVEADPSVIGGDEEPFADIGQQLNDYGLTKCAS